MLQSITVTYDATEDRLQLRLIERSADAESELRLMLTRRFSAALRRDLQTLVESSAAVPERLSERARAALVAGNHQAQAATVPLVRAPEPVSDRPTRSALATGVATGRRRSDGAWVLRFELRDDAPVTLTLRDDTLHAFARLLTQALNTADWGLPALPLDAPVDPAGARPLQELH